MILLSQFDVIFQTLAANIEMIIEVIVLIELSV